MDYGSKNGVGPLRQHSIGAALLDREYPARILGRLREPFIRWDDKNHSGYVPNVVYSCGSRVHGSNLVTPYTFSDHRTAIALAAQRDLINEILK